MPEGNGAVSNSRSELLWHLIPSSLPVLGTKESSTGLSRNVHYSSGRVSEIFCWTFLCIDLGIGIAIASPSVR